MKPENERWRPAVDFPGYEVSDMGRVRSYWTKGSTSQPTLMFAKLLKAGLVCPRNKGDPGRYYAVYLHRDRKRYTVKVCNLVLEAFVGPRPPGLQCRHLDDDKANNTLENLAWGSAEENYQDRVRNGLTNRRLTPHQVRWIRHLAEEGKTRESIAEMYSIARQTVDAIVNRETYKEIP